jgi:hypothetical protein
MFDRNKFLSLLPTGDVNLDDAISRSVQILDSLSQGQMVSNLQSKLSFQVNLLKLKMGTLPAAKQGLLKELLTSIDQARQTHQSQPFITGRGMGETVTDPSPLPGSDTMAKGAKSPWGNLGHFFLRLFNGNAR